MNAYEQWVESIDSSLVAKNLDDSTKEALYKSKGYYTTKVGTREYTTNSSELDRAVGFVYNVLGKYDDDNKEAIKMIADIIKGYAIQYSESISKKD